MRVSILTEGGKKIGFGHVTRCIALYCAFAQRGARPILIINGDGSIKNLVKGRKAKIFDWIKKKRQLSDIVKSSDIVVIDSYMADVQLYEYISRISRAAVYLDDYRRINYPKGFVVNGAAGAEKLNYPEKKGVHYLLGTSYTPMRKEFWKVRRPGIKKEIRDMLITLGGIPRESFIKNLLRYLKKHFPGLDYHILASKSSPHNAAAVRYLMLRSDICISAGGQTLYELARCGLPTIGVSSAENQTTNLNGLERCGFLRYAGRLTDKNIFDKIAGHIKVLSNQKTRKAVSQIGKGVVDGLGARRIAAFIYRHIPQSITVRKAVKRDCRAIWIWRNDYRVRSISFNKKKIAYKAHERWFKDRLHDNKTCLYVGENGKNKKIGQVRFDIDAEKGTALININLNPRFFGKGLGAQLIRLASEVFIKERPKVRKVLGEILEENIISQKAFLKAGYIYIRNGRKGGRKIVVFKYNNGISR